MRLLIITMNFLECESSFDTQLKCLDFDPTDTSKQNMSKESRRFGIDNVWKNNEAKVSHIHKNKKLNGAKLNEKEISCLKLWTNENVYNVAKQKHRRGETCYFRNLSEQIKKGLTKLKRHSQALIHFTQ